ncbi:MAG: hypothetical protein P8P48_09730, partial [Saprospiraceae bacterium]|nr:hypothetical protein [Saprospiraceae bacterium]
TICGGVDKIVENTKSYTIYIPTEYMESPLVVSISKEVADTISINFAETFKDRYVFVQGKIDTYRSKSRIVVRSASDFGLLQL